MNILLFGAKGQLGTKLKALLAAKGKIQAVDEAELDLRDLPRLRQLCLQAKPELIVNAAAYTAVDAAETDADNAQLVNRDAPRVMAEVAHELGALLLHYSTDYVFDGKSDRPYTEDMPTKPLGVYGRSKLAGEQAVADSGAAFVTLRTAWLYSNRGKNFLNTMLRLAAERNQLRVVADQFGSPSFADQVAESSLQILEAMFAAGGVRRARCGLYHMSCAGMTSWHVFATRIIELAGLSQRVEVVPIKTSDYPTAAQRPAYSVLSNAKLEQVFAIRLPDWEAALRRCLAERAGHG